MLLCQIVKPKVYSIFEKTNGKRFRKVLTKYKGNCNILAKNNIFFILNVRHKYLNVSLVIDAGGLFKVCALITIKQVKVVQFLD